MLYAYKMGLFSVVVYGVAALMFVVVGAIDYEKYGNVNVGVGPKDEQEIRFDRDNRGIKLMPEQAVEFKVAIAKYTEECFYQDLIQSEVFHVIFNVLKGGNKQVHLMVNNPDQKLIHEVTTGYTWYHIDNVTDAGQYKICFQNYDRHEKLVYINIITYTIDDMHSSLNEQESLELSSEVISNHLEKVIQFMHQIRRYQTTSRLVKIADSYYVETNNEYVMYYSIGQSCIIMICGLIQVYFIKKLFTAPTSSSKYKF